MGNCCESMNTYGWKLHNLGDYMRILPNSSEFTDREILSLQKLIVHNFLDTI